MNVKVGVFGRARPAQTLPSSLHLRKSNSINPNSSVIVYNWELSICGSGRSREAEPFVEFVFCLGKACFWSGEG